MPEEPKPAAPATATPAPAAVDPKATPAPVTPAAKPAEPAAAKEKAPDPKASDKPGEKSLLDQAGDEGKQTEQGDPAPQALIDAVEKWQKDPSPENKALAEKALADAKKSIEDAKAKPPVVAAVAPETYEFKMPEGTELDEAAKMAFSPALKEANITQAQLDKIMPVYAAQIKTLSEGVIANYEAEQARNYQDVIKGFQEETKKSLGANWKEQLADAAKIKERFLSKETMDLLTRSGAGDNIHFLRDLMKLGKMISPDKLIEGSNITKQPGAAEVMFPSMSK